MWLTSLLARAAPWLTVAAVLGLGAVAALGARRPPPRTITGGRARLLGTLAVGLLALAGAAWQAFGIGAARAPLPAGDRPLAEAAPAALAVLRQRIRLLETRLDELKHGITPRVLGPDKAQQLAVYLRQFGSRAVVISCTPNDVEAFDYATQIANALKSAGWDARGPESTTIFGDIRAIGINVYDSDAPPDASSTDASQSPAEAHRQPDKVDARATQRTPTGRPGGSGGSGTVDILLAAFAKFNIPYQARLAPSRAPAADAPVELFIGAQPIRPSAASPASRTP